MTALVLDGVWKKFRKGERHDTLRDLIPALVSRLSRRGRDARALAQEEFWAIRDVSFKMSAGESLGIIGPNGAGKSTILKLLTRILRPTRGTIAAKGRVGALIEVAAGFHPDLTGRENVFLQGAIMGMSRTEIARKFDAIVAFAGIEPFIDTPVKRYSSGMNARLGFSIAAHLDPDVLLVDEALAVGDASFQDQCVRRMRTLIASGMPLVFVSHNLAAVLDVCTRVVVLDRGSVMFDGDPADAILAYRRNSRTVSSTAAEPQNGVSITGVEVLDDNADELSRVYTGGPLTIRIRYSATQPIGRATFAVDMFREDGIYCAGVNTRMDSADVGPLGAQGSVELVIRRLWLVPGTYVLNVGILDEQGVRTLDLRERAAAFSVASTRKNLGLVYVDRTWRHIRAGLDVPQAKELV